MTGFLLLGGWFFFTAGALQPADQHVLELPGRGRGDGTSQRQRVRPGAAVTNLSVVLLIIVPMITMRSFAEEKRTGTYELL